MPYTELFTEGACVLAHLHPVSSAAEQNTGYFSLANYHRCVILINCGVLGGDLDVDIEQGTNTAGSGATSFDTASKDMTIHNADDNTLNAIEIRTEEMDVDGGFSCLNVEITAAGASIFDCIVLGFEPRFLPVGTTVFDTVTN